MSVAPVRLFVGFDQREAAAYHVFAQSVIERASVPVAIYPLARNMLNGFDGQQDGSNAFIYSRYLVPYLCDFTGWAIFADGDMVIDCDIAEIWNQRQDMTYKIGVSVVKHDYTTRNPRKYVGTPLESKNTDYPRKNWSSLMLWNCGYWPNRCLTPEFVGERGGEFLHRFKWLSDDEIGALPHWYNHLVGEDGPDSAKLNHYTLGVPGITHYADDPQSWKWHHTLLRSLECAGEDSVEMVSRAKERIGDAVFELR